MTDAMKCRSHLVGLGLALTLAAGCGGGIRPEVLKGWVGRPAASLEKDWGAPTREVPDGDLRILVYEEVERQRAGASKFDHQDPYGNNRDIHHQAQKAAEEAYRAPRVYVRSYLFWVDREGKIVHSAIRTP